MALTPQDQEFRKKLYQRLNDKPLEPGDPMYQPVYQMADCEDPINLIREAIELSNTESLHFFSGFRGSGKTTELFRLKKDLENARYVVLYANAMDYLNPAEPIEIADLLVVLAGAFSDAIEEETKTEKTSGKNIAKESYWTRLWHYLTTTEVQVTEFTLKNEAQVQVPLIGGLKSGLDVKAALRDTPSFRQNLQKFLASRISELHQQVRKFVEDGVKTIRKLRGEDTRIVFIFDSLEQLRGSRFSEGDVIRSVENLFANHFRMLELPYLHVVCTVPPWLRFVSTIQAPIFTLPSVKQWNNDDGRTKYPGGWAALLGLVQKRFENSGFQQFFGPNPQMANRLIEVCGGHFRDLLLLLRQTVLRADSLPVSSSAVEKAITALRNDFLKISVEDAVWLNQIEQRRDTCLPTSESGDVARLTRFLDTHFVLYFCNGDEWYDIHPLIRGKVAELAARAAAEATQSAQASPPTS